MAVDYKAIADRAEALVGLDVSRHTDAFETMKDETEVVQVEEHYESEVAMMSRLGVTQAEAILDKIVGAVSPRVKRMIESDRGINLADPQTQALISELVSNNILTQVEAGQVLEPTQITNLKWPGLRPGYVQNALEKRVAGKV